MTYYIFEFDPLSSRKSDKSSKGMIYTVYTNRSDRMDKFLRQHKMEDGRSMVQVVEDDDIEGYDIDGWNELKPYKFASNKRGKIYDVISTQQLVEEAYAFVTSELSSACLFGEAITKRKIPIIDQCCEAIEKLEFGYVLDLDDGEREYDYYQNLSAYKRNWRTGVGSTPTDETFYSEGPDDSIIADTLFEQFHITSSNEPHVITVEAYTAFFVSLVTDSV